MDIVLCEDHAIVRASMAQLFEAHGHRVVGAVDHPSTLVEVVEQVTPDVCVTDLLFDDDEGPGTDVLEAIAAVSAATDVVVLSGAACEEHREAARSAGASAVGSKSLSSRDILDLVEGRVGAPPEEVAPAANPFFLTAREIEVLQILADGDSTARMAERLGVGHATARSHVQSVLLKLGVHSRLAAVAAAVRHDLVMVSA